MSWNKKNPIWFFESIPGVAEREFTDLIWIHDDVHSLKNIFFENK